MESLFPLCSQAVLGPFLLLPPLSPVPSPLPLYFVFSVWKVFAEITVCLEVLSSLGTSLKSWCKAFSLSVTVCCLPAETLLVLHWKGHLAYYLFFQIPELIPSSQLYLSLVQMLVESLRVVVLPSLF